MDFIYKFRDDLWAYPTALHTAYNRSKPLGSIIIALAISVSIILGGIRTETLDALFSSAQGSTNTWREGVVGSVNSLNPLYLTRSAIDRDIYTLIYSRLVEVSRDGNVTPGVAESWSFDADTNKYTFEIRSDMKWHDGEELTASDVIFTLNLASELSSRPEGANTIGTPLADLQFVLIDDDTIEVIVPETTASILESLSVYILPEHVFNEVRFIDLYRYGQNGILPIGSGQYQVTSFKPAYIEFARFENHPDLGNGNIENLEYYVFAEYDDLVTAFENQLLDGVSGINDFQSSFIDPYSNFKNESVLLSNRKKSLYLNTGSEKLGNTDLRKGLAHILDKKEILKKSQIAASPTFSPISSSSWAFNNTVDYYSYDLEKAKTFFETAGYKLQSGKLRNEAGDQLELTLTYVNNYENQILTETLKDSFEAYGIKIILNPKSPELFINENLSRREFDILLFEVETLLDPDQYNLWHSLRVNYPDLNISGYSYERVDILLERARSSTDRDSRKKDYQLFQRYIAEDVPVIFLYEPVYTYHHVKRLENLDISKSVYPSDRLKTLSSWVID